MSTEDRISHEAYILQQNNDQIPGEGLASKTNFTPPPPPHLSSSPVASAASVLKRWFCIVCVCPQCFWELCVRSLYCFAVLCVLSSFAILAGEEKAGCFTFDMFNNTGAGMLDAIYHMTLKLLLNRVFVRNHDRSLLLHTVILSFENFAKPLRKVYFF